MLLRPLVHLLLSKQITFPILTTLLKELYVEVASEEFQIEGKRLTDSRINLLTGIHRKDVRRFREETLSGLVMVRAIPFESEEFFRL